MVGGSVWGIGLRRLGCVCGRRLGTGSCVLVRQTTTLVVPGLIRAFLCLRGLGHAFLSIHLQPVSICLSEGRSPRQRATSRKMRIVSLLPSLTEIVAALGLGDSIVGLTHSCDYPKEAVEGKVVVTSTEISPYTMSQAQIHTTPPTPPACLPGIPRGY